MHIEGLSEWLDSFHPKLVESIPPSEARIKELQNKYGAADMCILTEKEHIYEHDIYVAPMFNTMGYLDIEFYVVSK